VLDNGPGIAPEDLETIFSPFVSSKGQGGTGLGLAVVKKTVEEHGGYAKVSSVVGKGTKFELHVPIREEGVDKEGTEGPAGRSDMAHPRSDEDIHATQDLLPEELEEAQRRAEMTQEQE